MAPRLFPIKPSPPPPRVPPWYFRWSANVAIVALVWWSLASFSSLYTVPYWHAWDRVFESETYSQPYGWALLMAIGLNIAVFRSRRSPGGGTVFHVQMLVNFFILGIIIALTVRMVPLQVSLDFWGDELRDYALSLETHPDAARSRQSRMQYSELLQGEFRVLELPGGTDPVFAPRTIGPFRIGSHFYFEGRPVIELGAGSHGFVFDPVRPARDRLVVGWRRDPGAASTALWRINDDWQVFFYFNRSVSM